ncbi:hypothetical protein EYF80_019593 [Liparis tanakae]|uniref:Uncharacterized protein n=1 Tax=Liparis tanakae TaxID=230148 RepID=A0A4Z2HZ41_9TELE|nr:hypothetical protein EYF80_019593 [Liparis tanakae]
MKLLGRLPNTDFVHGSERDVPPQMDMFLWATYKHLGVAGITYARQASCLPVDPRTSPTVSPMERMGGDGESSGSQMLSDYTAQPGAKPQRQCMRAIISCSAPTISAPRRDGDRLRVKSGPPCSAVPLDEDTRRAVLHEVTLDMAVSNHSVVELPVLCFHTESIRFFAVITQRYYSSDTMDHLKSCTFGHPPMSAWVQLDIRM